MAESTPRAQEKASTTSTVVTETDSQTRDVPTVHLKLKKPKCDRKVNWTTDTVDNEDMNKKKSKCCCIYHKPRQFGESSSSESDDECEHCHGHVEKKKKYKKHSPTSTQQASSVVTTTETQPPVPNSPDEEPKSDSQPLIA